MPTPIKTCNTCAFKGNCNPKDISNWTTTDNNHDIAGWRALWRAGGHPNEHCPGHRFKLQPPTCGLTHGPNLS